MRSFKEILEDVVETDEYLTERKFFKTRKRIISKNKKKNLSKRKIDKRDRKVYYRKNKARIKKNRKIYLRKTKARPSLVRTHRK